RRKLRSQSCEDAPKLILGAIDISPRLTRLHVVEVARRSSRRLTERNHSVTAELVNLERLTALLMAEVETARDAGAEHIEVTAGPELRGSRLIRLLERASRGAGSGPIRIPSGRERVAAAYLAATVPDPAAGATTGIGLIDDTMLGLGVGHPAQAPAWIGTRPAGSTTVTDRARFSDPPRPNQIDAAIAGACRAIDSLEPPAMERLLVVSPFAPVIARLCGPQISHDDARRGLESILGQTSDDLSAWFGVDPASSRYLPGAIVGHAALADAFAVPVEPVTADLAAGRHWLELDRQPSGRSVA
ncbi:MAG: hypothetical protein M3Y45_08960, partial [Actinomycetota bacterium]|nr:hypothetical protein [Actinomycetota bacterium]